MCLVDDLKKTILTKQTDLYAYSCNGKQITLRNGKRWIPNRDLNANKRIYLIGPCITAGRYTDDHNTVGFFLQEKLYGCGYEVHMLNASPDWGNYMKWLGHIKVRKGDVIIFIDVWKRLHQIDLDMRESFQNAYDSYGQFFLDTPVHCNHIGHKVLAEEIYSAFFSDKIFNDTIETDSVPRTYISEFHKDIPLVFCGNPELEKYKEYLRSIKTDCKGTIGAIVMNCNPFTLGHRYLIEYAHDQVDFLYIFVVQEDRSNFSFKERMEFVKKGTADLDRIMVLPSGKFIISADTFSEYFVKGMAKSGNVDTSLDVETFAQHIAPILNISVRFLGEEPFDPITLQYNQDMLEILPDYGIKVDVISRKEIAGEKISASKVRKLLDEHNWEKIKTLVPDTTYKYLQQKKI